MNTHFQAFLENNTSSDLVDTLFTYLGEETTFFRDEKIAKQSIWQSYKKGFDKYRSQEEDDWEIIENTPTPVNPQVVEEPIVVKKKYAPREIKPPRTYSFDLYSEINKLKKCQCQATQTIPSRPLTKASASPDQSRVAPIETKKTIIPLQYLHPGRRQAIPLPYAHPPVDNGGQTDKYVWTQTLEEVQIKFSLPLSERARDLNVQIKPESILVKTQKTGEVLMNKQFYKEINDCESYWQLEGCDLFGIKKKLTLYLQKEKQLQWWKQAFQGDQQIDISKIKPTQNDSMLQDESNVEYPHAFDRVIREKAYSESMMMNKLARKSMMDQFFQQKPDIFAAYSP